MKKAEILSSLTDIFRQYFDDATIALTLKTTARDIPEWDSAKMVMLILAVEERFEITMRSREIDALTCIGDWVELIHAHIQRV
jgi:acyl carrier protein